MAPLTHQQYDQLERAVANAERITVSRRGTEYVLIPLRLRVANGRELLETRNPTTGDDLVIYLDEVDVIEALP
jgi:hypothetical protein